MTDSDYRKYRSGRLNEDAMPAFEVWKKWTRHDPNEMNFDEQADCFEKDFEGEYPSYIDAAEDIVDRYYDIPDWIKDCIDWEKVHGALSDDYDFEMGEDGDESIYVFREN